jgi:hypothetical protein
MRGAEPGSASTTTHVVPLNRWLPRFLLIRRIEAAVPGCLVDGERLVACLPSVGSSRFRHVYVGSAGLTTPLAIALTTHRVLFFGVRHGWLDLIDAPARRDVELVEAKTGKWAGGDEFYDVIVLRVREERIKFSIETRWTQRRAVIEELTRPGTDSSSAQGSISH